MNVRISPWAKVKILPQEQLPRFLPANDKHTLVLHQIVLYEWGYFCHLAYAANEPFPVTIAAMIGSLF